MSHCKTPIIVVILAVKYLTGLGSVFTFIFALKNSNKEFVSLIIVSAGYSISCDVSSLFVEIVGIIKQV